MAKAQHVSHFMAQHLERTAQGLEGVLGGPQGLGRLHKQAGKRKHANAFPKQRLAEHVLGFVAGVQVVDRHPEHGHGIALGGFFEPMQD
jgi:hypothetical protein